MTTFKGIPTTKTATETQPKSWYADLLKRCEEDRIGLMAPFILVLGCMSGVAVYFMWQDFNVFRLAVIAFSTVIPLALMLAVAPMRLIVPVLAFSVLNSIIIIITSFF